MVLTYRYKVIKGRTISEDTKTPLIDLVIKRDKLSIETTAIPDSGADVTAVPLEIAEVLGLDLSKAKDKCVGIGGWVESKPSSMKIQLGNEHESYSFTIPVKVILGDFSFPILLGREGFFDKFKITFDQKEKKVILRRILK